MNSYVLILTIVNLIISFMLIAVFFNLRRIILNMEIKKYKNCILEMLKVKEKFDELSKDRIKQLKTTITELEEVAEAVDEKILYYESLRDANDKY